MTIHAIDDNLIVRLDGSTALYMPPDPGGIIFSTNFENDAGFLAHTQNVGSWASVGANKPVGFDGVWLQGGSGSGRGAVSGMAGEGIGGSVALKLEWADSAQPVVNLFKHLTGDENTGYKKIYMRYRVRLPNGHLAGYPGNDDYAYHKWARLWQNTGVAPGNKWTENRDDSGYAVMNFNGTATYGVYAGGTFSANFDASGLPLSGGSANGARYSTDYYQGSKSSYVGIPGAFNNMGAGAWDFDKATRQLIDNTNQGWHTIEWLVELASSDTANDGVFRIWFDDIEQIPIQDIRPKNPTPVLADLLPGEIPTSSRGAGINMAVIFDNMQFVNQNWGLALTGGNNGIFLNDLVISRSRIGHNYDAQNIDNTGVGAT